MTAKYPLVRRRKRNWQIRMMVCGELHTFYMDCFGEVWTWKDGRVIAPTYYRDLVRDAVRDAGYECYVDWSGCQPFPVWDTNRRKQTETVTT